MKTRLIYGTVSLLLLAITACSSTVGKPQPDPQGDVISAPPPPGVDSALWAELNAELQAQLAARKASVAKPITDPQFRVDDFALVSTDEANRLLTFSWSYQQLPGDYDLNGVVGISDLAPIGKYYEHSTASPDWEQAQLADGDGNGVITFGDITQIATNYDNAVHAFMFGVEFQDYDNNGQMNIADLSQIGYYIMKPNPASLGLGAAFASGQLYPDFGETRASDAELPDAYVGTYRLPVKTAYTQVVGDSVIHTASVGWIPTDGSTSYSVPSTYYSVVPYRIPPNATQELPYDIGQISEQILVVHP